MSSKQGVFQELAALLADVQRHFPHWSQREVVTQIRRSMAEYNQGVWELALPLNRGESSLIKDYRERFAELRRRAIIEERLDLGHVFTSIDVKQNVDVIRDAYASWAGDLGTHVLANYSRQTQSSVGEADSPAGLEDLHGDIDGDNIGRHMPKGEAIRAILAYYLGDETLMNGVTVGSRYQIFARDLGLIDRDGHFNIDREQVRFALHNRTREFIALDEINLDAHEPLKLLKDLFDTHEHDQVEILLDAALEQFLSLIAAGVERERNPLSNA
ncbi:MAG: hypothetical protein ACK2U0_21050 [Candidatus Promineifilaceae bacterium]